jgi:hypothetical protein
VHIKIYEKFFLELPHYSFFGYFKAKFVFRVPISPISQHHILKSTWPSNVFESGAEIFHLFRGKMKTE